MTSTRPQHLDALDRANEKRLAGAALKRALKAGEITIGEALNDPAAGHLEVEVLLRAMTRWGRVRAQAVLAAEAVSVTKRVEDLTDRQRAAIAGRIEAKR